MSIKINLLPAELRPKRKLISFDRRVVLVFMIVVAAAAMVSYYLVTVKNLKLQEEELRIWVQAEKTLQKTVDLQNEVNRLRDNVKKRVDVIRDLTGDTELRFSILQHINAVIPTNLWLTRISETEEEGIVYLTIEGISYYKKDISTFLASLQTYENFKSVSLESIRPAPLEIRDAYEYSVKVEPRFIERKEEAQPARGTTRRATGR